MKIKTKMIIQQIAKQHGKSPEEIEKDMKEAIRAAMASTNPDAQMLWKQVAPDGKEPSIDTFLEFCANRLKMMTAEQNDRSKGN